MAPQIVVVLHAAVDHPQRDDRMELLCDGTRGRISSDSGGRHVEQCWILNREIRYDRRIAESNVDHNNESWCSDIDKRYIRCSRPYVTSTTSNTWPFSRARFRSRCLTEAGELFWLLAIRGYRFQIGLHLFPGTAVLGRLCDFRRRRFSLFYRTAEALYGNGSVDKPSTSKCIRQ